MPASNKVTQSNLLIPCDELPDFNDVTGKGVLDTVVVWGAMYRECQIRHSGLIEAIGK